jgi:hypothetical protein
MAIVQDGTRWFSVNFVPASGHGTRDVLWEMASVMIAAGWTGVQSGNGTTKTAGTPVSNPFLVATTGWIQLRAPTGTLEVTLQRNSGEDYSARGYLCDIGFGGGGTASAPPTHADAIQIIGSSGSYDGGGWGWASINATNYRWQFCADSAPVSGHYYFHWIGRVVSSGAGHRRVVFDPVETNADGTIGDADDAPWVVWLQAGGNNLPLNSASDGRGWYKRNLTGQALETALAIFHTLPGTALGQNPYTGTHERAAPLIYKVSTNAQRKGVASTIRFATMSSISAFDTLDLADTGRAMIAPDSNGCFVPWPSTVTPVI